MAEFKSKYRQYLSDIEIALSSYLPAQPADQGGLPVEAARYSLLGGGKRIRPVLLLAVCEMTGFACAAAMPYACALEMIHTYSLIHDDLPCMDDDDIRRGRPSCHKAYGETIALLAGDTLLNRAYEILLEAISPRHIGSIDAARVIAEAAGSKGMIGGQALDLSAEGRTISEEDLRRMHKMKTGALLKAPVMAAACLSGLPEEIGRMLLVYSESIGLSFQIQDDILDMTADPALLGKSTGKDEKHKKATYVSLFGLEEARRRLADTIEEARKALSAIKRCGLKTEFLSELTGYLLVRTS